MNTLKSKGWRSSLVIGCLVGVTGLTGCGGSSNSGTGGTESPPPVDNNAQVLTTPTSTESFVEQYKDLLKKNFDTGSTEFDGLFNETVRTVDAPAAPDAGESLDSDTSGTNTILDDVDESDYVKYDGRYLYAYQTGYEEDWRWYNRLSVIDTEPEEPEVVNSVDLGESSLVGMYLREPAGEKQIVAVSTEHSYYAFAEIWPGPTASTTTISLVSGLPQNPEISETLELEGSLLASRMIENRLILVTGFLPYFDVYPMEDRNEEGEFPAIDALTATDILPGYRLNKGEEVALVDASDCLVLENDTEFYGTPQILTITTVNLDDTSDIHSTCTTSFAQAFFISTDSLYLTDYAEDGTLIHKFALDDSGTAYRGTGKVPGYVRGGEYSFHLYAQNGDLFALSTTWKDGDFDHRFTVLREDASEENVLSVVAQLPNDSQPQTIGKPGEDVFAVRFFDDTAFVVTFEQIDPLYAIDISNPGAPFIAGELELPGVSEYLHPISGDLLLGVGHNGQWPRELQVNLFDISDITQPSLITQETFPSYLGAWTTLSYDHHAFAAVTDGDVQWAKAAFPFTVYPQVWVDDGVVAPEEVDETGTGDATVTNNSTDMPMPVEPDGGIGDGAGPLPDLGDQPIPVEPDGGIGDGAEPLPNTDADNDRLVADIVPMEQNYLMLLDIDKVNRGLATPRVKTVTLEQPYSYYQRIVIDGEEIIFVSNSAAEKHTW